MRSNAQGRFRKALGHAQHRAWRVTHRRNDQPRLFAEDREYSSGAKQISLDDLAGTPIAETTYTGTNKEKFLAFHEANPHVYDLFERLALEAHARGKRKIGGRMLWERMRWEFFLNIKGDEAPKLNDHLLPHFVRRLVDNHPELRESFELRELRAA